MIQTGTREWSVASINIDDGCEHGCRYCYARHRAVCHYHRLTQEQWDNPVTKQHKVDLPYTKKYDGRVMFPTSHDITPRNLSEYLCVLRKLLDAGNKVLIVSKPHLPCITTICEAYQDYKDQILFRFTIGSISEKVLKFWDNDAPGFEERLACLQYAYKSGFQTSVSCEPYLDPFVVNTYKGLSPWINESFWVGKLNGFNYRVNLDGVTPEQLEKFVRPLKFAMTDGWVKKLYKAMNGQMYVMWKESIRKVMTDKKNRKSRIESWVENTNMSTF